MTICLIFGEETIRVICVYASQNGKPEIQKDKFYDELVYEWDMKGTKEMTLGLEDFNGHVGKKVDGFEGTWKKWNWVQNLEGRMLLEFCD